MLSPGGVLRPFWLAVRTTSSPHASKRISSLATEHTQSATTYIRLSEEAQRYTGSTYESVGGDLLHSLCNALCIGQDTCATVLSAPTALSIQMRVTCRRIHVCERNDFVLLGLESSLDVGKGYGSTKWRPDLIHVRAVRAKAAACDNNVKESAQAGARTPRLTNRRSYHRSNRC